MPTISDCPACSAAVPAGNRYCTSCGVAVDAPAPLRRPRQTFAAKRRTASIGRARRILLVLAVLFAVAGGGFGYFNLKKSQEAKDSLSSRFTDDEVVKLEDGSMIQVAQLKQQIDQEALLVFVLNFGFAIALFALWWWARRSPFPAVLTGLCLYLCLQVLALINDPAQAMAGILVKVLVVAALLSGLQAALSERIAQRRTEEEAEESAAAAEPA